MHSIFRTVGATIFGMVLHAWAHAGVMVWPIDPVIEAEQSGTVLWMENNGKAPVRMQIRIMAWAQSAGEEALSAQDDVIASPPAAQVEPGQRQLVRLVRTRPVEAGRERAYRVLIDEVPDTLAATPEAPGAPSVGLALQMRYSVPLFVSGAGVWTHQSHQKPRDMTQAAQPKLKFRIEADASGRWLVLRNDGMVHARLSVVSYEQGGRTVWEVPGLLGYVLPGIEMRFKAPNSVTGGGRLRAKVNSNIDAQSIPTW